MSDNTHTPPEVPPAGWYPDPHDSNAQRYWDGARWTAHTAVWWCPQSEDCRS